MALIPTFDDADEVVILQPEEDDDKNENCISVDNEATLQVIFEIFKKDKRCF